MSTCCENDSHTPRRTRHPQGRQDRSGYIAGFLLVFLLVFLRGRTLPRYSLLLLVFFSNPTLVNANEVVTAPGGSAATSAGTSATSATHSSKQCLPPQSELTKEVRALAGMTEAAKNLGVQSDWSSETEKNRLNSKQKALLREFADKNLVDASRNTKTVFYPFGGPDAIYPSLFFPNAKFGQRRPTKSVPFRPVI